jgi:K+-transporting ATPase KdpF subunit
VILADAADDWIGLALAIALLAYLVVALVFPERF